MLAGSLLAAVGSLGSAPLTAEEVAMRQHVETVAKIAASFAALAGGEDNAVALVESLREGADVHLTYPASQAHALPQVVPIEPPTGPMDWSDVRMALLLARDALMAVGVTRPNGEQLHAVLLGGEVPVPGDRVARFKGVLTMRAYGYNWGAVASERFRRDGVTRAD
jgi:hypothetical protein